MNIKTSYDHPPIPDRAFDWSAVTDNYDLGHPIGHGATKAEAVTDLLRQLPKTFTLAPLSSSPNNPALKPT